MPFTSLRNCKQQQQQQQNAANLFDKHLPKTIELHKAKQTSIVMFMVPLRNKTVKGSCLHCCCFFVYLWQYFVKGLFAINIRARTLKRRTYNTQLTLVGMRKNGHRTSTIINVAELLLLPLLCARHYRHRRQVL